MTISGSPTVEVFWKAFGTLRSAERLALAERILRDRRMLDDIYDHFLIEQSKKEKGKSITLDEYLARRKKHRA